MRRFLRWALFGCALLGLFLFALLGAATCRPAWYQPASADFSQLQSDQADLVRLADAIGRSLNAHEPIEFTLPAEQVNRWLAARRELFPDVVFPELDRLLVRPMIRIDSNGVAAAALVDLRGWPVVMSTTLRPVLLDDAIEVELAGAHVGRLAAPQFALDQIAAAIRRAQSPPETSMASGRIRLPRRLVWPNGKCRFAISRLDFAEGRVTVQLVPD